MDGFPSLCEDWLSMADQLDLVKNLPLIPDFIINIKVKRGPLPVPILIVSSVPYSLISTLSHVSIFLPDPRQGSRETPM